MVRMTIQVSGIARALAAIKRGAIMMAERILNLKDWGLKGWEGRWVLVYEYLNDCLGMNVEADTELCCFDGCEGFLSYLFICLYTSCKRQPVFLTCISCSSFLLAAHIELYVSPIIKSGLSAVQRTYSKPAYLWDNLVRATFLDSSRLSLLICNHGVLTAML